MNVHRILFAAIFLHGLSFAGFGQESSAITGRSTTSNRPAQLDAPITQPAPSGEAARMLDVSNTRSRAMILGPVGTNAIVLSESVWPAADVDLYRFEAKAGQRIGFDIDTTPNGPPGLGSYLRVFNSSGNELASNNDRLAPGDGPPGANSGTDGFDSYIEYTFGTAGTYFVGVSNWQHRSYNVNTGAAALGNDTRWLTGAYSLVINSPNVDLVATGFKYSIDADSSNKADPNLPVSLNGPLPVNAQFRVEATVANRGTTPSGTTTVGLYLSTDAVVNTADTRIAYFSLPSIKPNATSTIVGRCVLPPNNLAKKVWIGLVVDPASQIVETDKTNNVNRGENVDRRTVQLYDPIGRVYFYPYYPSKSDAVQALLAAGFTESPTGTGGGYTRHLSSNTTIRSRYDGVSYTGHAFRQHAFIFASGGKYTYYDINSQGWKSQTFSSWTIVVQGDTQTTEPSPVYAAIVAGLFPDYGRYVRDWHSRY